MGWLMPLNSRLGLAGGGGSVMLRAVPGDVHAKRGAIMSRVLLCGVVSGLVLSSSTLVRADDAEDKAAALVEKLGGKVIRDETRPGKPVIEVGLWCGVL